MPSASSERPALSGVRSSRTPSASSTSALPVRLDIARLPCLATATPHEAVRMAADGRDVELGAAASPPPVPQVSSSGERRVRSGGTRSRWPAPCPAIVGGLALHAQRDGEGRRSAPAWPRRQYLFHAGASEVARQVLTGDGAARWRTRSRSGTPCWRHRVRKFSISLRPRRGEDALGVELHAPGLVLLVLDAHELVLGRPRHDLEALRQRLALDDQRVIARGLERVVEPGERARGPCAGSGLVLPCMSRGARITRPP